MTILDTNIAANETQVYSNYLLALLMSTAMGKYETSGFEAVFASADNVDAYVAFKQSNIAIDLQICGLTLTVVDPDDFAYTFYFDTESVFDITMDVLLDALYDLEIEEGLILS